MYMPDGVWLMDTGCGHDLIDEKYIAGYPVETLIAEHAPTFSTANGRITATMVSPMYSEILQETIRPYVLPETPPVLTIGKRCMEQGDSFIWCANEAPIFVMPDQTILQLEVHRNIPVLNVSDQMKMPHMPTKFQCVPLAPSIEVAREETLEAFDMGDEEERAIRVCDQNEPVGEPVAAEVMIVEAGDEGQDEDDPRRQSQKERLVDEAKSLVHKLTHLPKNPYCDSCQRGKIKEKYSRRGAFKREIEKWCELVTFDHLYSGSKNPLALTANMMLLSYVTSTLASFTLTQSQTSTLAM